MNVRDWAILLLLSMLWGGSFFFIEIAVASVRPLTLLLLRVTIAAAALWLFLWARRERMTAPPGAIRSFLVLALFNNVLPMRSPGSTAGASSGWRSRRWRSRPDSYRRRSGDAAAGAAVRAARNRHRSHHRRLGGAGRARFGIDELRHILYFRLIATAGATNALLVTFLIPITAILLGSLLLGETLEPRYLAGMAAIGAGLAAIDGRLLRWRPFRRRLR